MINVRLVSNIKKEADTFTLVNVKILAENPTELKRIEAVKEVNEEFTNVSSLFTSIQNNVVSLIQSEYV